MEVVSRLIGMIYDAAVDPQRWPAFLNSFSDAIHASGCALLHHDLRDWTGTISVAVRVDPDALSKYGEYFAAIDPWMRRGAAAGLLESGDVRLGQEIVRHEEFVKTEYYGDFAKHYQLTQIIGGVIRRDDSVTSSLTTLRPDSEDSFGEDDRTFMRLLLPHLQQALQLHRRLVGLELAHATAIETLEHMPLGVVLVHRDGTVTFANRAARVILEGRDGLTIDDKKILAWIPSESKRLRNLVSAAAHTGVGGQTRGGAMAVSRPSMRRRLELLVTPLRTLSLPELGELANCAAVFFTDPEHADEPRAELMVRFWGLTRTEARIAAILATGRGINEAADRLGITRNTARWHVKHVLAKTGAKRQADLVRLVLSSPASVADS
jgi:DNA-binding CsgD family transcriptional regulator